MKPHADSFEDTCRLECDECTFTWEGPERDVEDEAMAHHAMTGHHPAEVAPRNGMPGPRVVKGEPAGYIDPLYVLAPVKPLICQCKIPSTIDMGTHCFQCGHQVVWLGSQN